ncbi:MAG: HD-GYP domain-containing protein [Candidatus Omnitrophica bacterium]|nr:HD-GYP domain-containing protein [Candidatus Omnitrophota bacterium]
MGIDSAEWLKVQDVFLSRLPKNKKSDYHYTQRDSSDIDYGDTLFDASRSMIRFRKPHRLARMIDKIINEKVGVTHSAVLVCEDSSKNFILIDSRGDRGRMIPKGYVKLDAKSPVIEVLKDRKNIHFFENGILNQSDLRWILGSGQLLNKGVFFHNRLNLALTEMELLDAEVCIPCFFKRELTGLLILGKKSSGRNYMREELKLFAALADDAAMAIANSRLIEGLKKRIDEVEHICEREHQLFINTAATLAKAIDARDVYTHGHTERVSEFCSVIADELTEIPEIRLEGRFKEKLHMTALLHDIGKIGIPDRLLNKKRKLTSSERKVVEGHPSIGASILCPMPELKEVAKCVRSHQEWYNGNGYPDGLKRDEIPLIARIVSVADAFDAITSDRPYRKPLSGAEAVEEIRDSSGTQFDPSITKAFLKAYNKKIIRA